jgi:hypothetical protein
VSLLSASSGRTFRSFSNAPLNRQYPSPAQEGEFRARVDVAATGFAAALLV